MSVTTACREERLTVEGIAIEVLRGGHGQPTVVLHDYEYLNQWQPYLDILATRYSVIVPSHPGFGKSDLPDDFDTVDDLAHFYLVLLRSMGLNGVNLVGLGFGGWIAAEMAVRCTHRLKSLVLVDAVGIKVSDRTTRDIVDHFIIGPEEFLKLAWHDPSHGALIMKLPGLGQLSEPELVTLLRNRQSAALFGWKPFMHNPKLLRRLAAVDVPTLVVWGESDRIVSPDYGRAYAQCIPGARFELIKEAGHFPYLERPEHFVQAVSTFLAGLAP